MDDHIRLCDEVEKNCSTLLQTYMKEPGVRPGKQRRPPGVGLVEASLRGVDSHGIMRTAAYFERYRKKAITM